GSLWRVQEQRTVLLKEQALAAGNLQSLAQPNRSQKSKLYTIHAKKSNITRVSLALFIYLRNLQIIANTNLREVMKNVYPLKFKEVTLDSDDESIYIKRIRKKVRTFIFTSSNRHEKVQMIHNNAQNMEIWDTLK
ncbi:hypothetical protein ACJX0J_008392, partial [Zea mays]